MVVVNDKANGNPHVGAGSHARPGEGGMSEHRDRACPARRLAATQRCEGQHYPERHTILGARATCPYNGPPPNPHGQAWESAPTSRTTAMPSPPWASPRPCRHQAKGKRSLTAWADIIAGQQHSGWAQGWLVQLAPTGRR